MPLPFKNIRYRITEKRGRKLRYAWLGKKLLEIKDMDKDKVVFVADIVKKKIKEMKKRKKRKRK